MSDKKHGNPLLADRRSHMNSNGFVLGTSGAGKSFNVKAEMAECSSTAPLTSRSSSIRSHWGIAAGSVLSSQIMLS